MKRKFLRIIGSAFLAVILCGLTFTFFACGGSDDRDSEATRESIDSQWKEDEALKILAVGNSFSDDSLEYVYRLAANAGIPEIKLGILYIGGCSIETHVGNARYDRPIYDYRINTRGTWNTTPGVRMRDALEEENWDFVTLQQASGLSGKESSYELLGELIDYVKENTGGSPRLIWNMTWAYEPYTPPHPQFIDYGNDSATMYQAIVDTVKAQVETRKEISAIIPTGTAIQNARTSYAGNTLTRDGYHLGFGLGRYIAGLTVFHRLTGLPIDDADEISGLDETDRLMAIESAKNAVLAPYAVTPSEYKSKK